jgi:hypothetical protein
MGPAAPRRAPQRRTQKCARSCRARRPQRGRRVIRPLRTQAAASGARHRRASAGPLPPRSRRVARRSDGCLAESAGQPARSEAEASSLSPHAPARKLGRVFSGRVVSALPTLARPLGLGVQSLVGVTLRCSRLTWSLAGSADRLVKGAVAFGLDLETAGETDDRSQYALHWISPYESDVWK